jgi:hypothetical protein
MADRIMKEETAPYTAKAEHERVYEIASPQGV